MNNTKLVMLCGAGFPLMWGAPTSKVLTNRIKEIIRAKLGNKKSNVKNLFAMIPLKTSWPLLSP